MSTLEEQAAEVLEKGAKIIDKGFWTQDVMARDVKKNRVATNSPDACYFCALGVLWYSADSLAQRNRPQIEEIAQIALVGWIQTNTKNSSIASFNDDCERTAKQVSDAMKAAAAELRSQVYSLKNLH